MHIKRDKKEEKKENKRKEVKNCPKNLKDLFLKTFLRENPMAYDKSKKKCCYNKEINGGCVIGIWLPENQDLENIEGISAIDIDNEYLPKKWVNKKIPKEFLERLQSIHDDKGNWNDHKTAKKNKYGVVWSKKGIKKFNDLKKDYKININLKQEIIKLKKK